MSRTNHRNGRLRLRHGVLWRIRLDFCAEPPQPPEGSPSLGCFRCGSGPRASAGQHLRALVGPLPHLRVCGLAEARGSQFHGAIFCGCGWVRFFDSRRPVDEVRPCRGLQDGSGRGLLRILHRCCHRHRVLGRWQDFRHGGWQRLAAAVQSADGGGGAPWRFLHAADTWLHLAEVQEARSWTRYLHDDDEHIKLVREFRAGRREFRTLHAMYRSEASEALPLQGISPDTILVARDCPHPVDE